MTCFLTKTWLLLDFCLTFLWLILDFDLTFLWPKLDFFSQEKQCLVNEKSMTFAWLLFDFSLTKTWPQQLKKTTKSQVTIHWLWTDCQLTFFFTEPYPCPCLLQIFSWCVLNSSASFMLRLCDIAYSIALLRYLIRDVSLPGRYQWLTTNPKSICHHLMVVSWGFSLTFYHNTIIVGPHPFVSQYRHLPRPCWCGYMPSSDSCLHGFLPYWAGIAPTFCHDTIIVEPCLITHCRHLPMLWQCNSTINQMISPQLEVGYSVFLEWHTGVARDAGWDVLVLAMSVFASGINKCHIPFNICQVLWNWISSWEKKCKWALRKSKYMQ